MTTHCIRTADVVLIDGRSGSGKTTLAVSLADGIERERGVRPQIIGMDELYPGWSGLADGSASLPGVLRSTGYSQYDWAREQFATEIEIDPLRPLIVEGCGSLTRASLAAARQRGSIYAVWIEGPEALRKKRALGRDGDMFAPHWVSWAEQETAHFKIARPWSIAREIMHTTAMLQAK